MKPRAPFVWIVDASLPELGQVRDPSSPLRKNRWFLFRRSFNLRGRPASARARITVDGRYQLYVNGDRVGRGPMRCAPAFQRYDVHDLTTRLRRGENTIGVLVHTYGVDTGWYELARDTWADHFGDGALWFECDVADFDGALTIDSDQAWRGIEARAWENDTPRMQDGLGFIEVFDARGFPQGWLEAGFDVSAWRTVTPLAIGGGGPDAYLGGVEIRPFPTLIARSLPMSSERDVLPARIVGAFGLAPRPELPIERRAYEEELLPIEPGVVRDLERLLSAEGCAHVSSAPCADTFILFEFDRLLTGYPFIELEASGGEIIEIAVSENLPGAWSDEGAEPNARITRAPIAETTDAHICRLVARPGVQRFERFEWDAVKWMQLVVRNAPEGLAVTKIGTRFTAYPVERRGRFSCSDAFLEKLWATGAYTVELCMHDGWEDCPSREQRQWLGDATVEHLVGQAAFGPCVAPLNANFLRQVAEAQDASGLMPKFAPGDWRDNAIGLPIPDWTLQWILNAGDHWLYTGDLETIAEIFPAMQKALAWFDRQVSPAGLVADAPYWHFMDWAALGRTGEACTLNAQLAGCFKVAADLADALEYGRAAQLYQRRASDICAALNARHWDGARGCFVDVVDPRSGRQGRRVSQHANAAMALWGDADPDRVQQALDYITDPARLVFTAAPPITQHSVAFDEDNDVVLANTFYSHFVYSALIHYGRLGSALSLMREKLGPMIAKGSSTLWESLAPSASLCHGFSASPTYQLTAGVLGVRPAAPGFGKAWFAPDLGDLGHARGIAPTPKGDVRIELAKTASGFTAKLQAPGDMEVVAVEPPGFSLDGGVHEIFGEAELHYARSERGSRKSSQA